MVAILGFDPRGGRAFPQAPRAQPASFHGALPSEVGCIPDLQAGCASWAARLVGYALLHASRSRDRPRDFRLQVSNFMSK